MLKSKDKEYFLPSGYDETITSTVLHFWNNIHQVYLKVKSEKPKECYIKCQHCPLGI